MSSETDHRSGPRFLAWPHRSLAAQRLKEAKVDGAMTREMGRPHQSEGIAAQARAAPRRHLRDGAGIGADPPPYHTAKLDQLSISLCHVGNCSRGRPPTPTSDARCGDAGDDGLRRVRCGSGKGRGGGCSARRGHGEEKKDLKRDHRVKTTPKTHPSSLVISTVFWLPHTFSPGNPGQPTAAD